MVPTENGPPAVTGGFTRYAPTASAARWLLVAGRRFVACVESTVSDSIVDAVWWLADSELATIESVVGSFPLSGPESIRSFAVAELGSPSSAGEVVVTAVVRGSAAIDVFSVGGARRFSAAGVQPWVLAEFRTVTGLVLGGDDLPTGPVARMARGSLPLARGVVDGELLTWTVTPIERVQRTAPPAAPGAVSSAPTSSKPQSSSMSQSQVGGADETIIRGRAQTSSLFGHLTEDAPQRVHAALHELPGAVDIEAPDLHPAPGDDTPEEFRYPPLAELSPPTEPVPLPAPPTTFAILAPTGEILPLDRPVVLGRKPALPRVGSSVPARILGVPSPTREVSATHLRVEQLGDAVVVTDLRSTNGTWVLRPESPAERLRPGESTVVVIGTALEIGDGNIIEIIAAPVGGRWGIERPGDGVDRREEGLE